MINSDLKLTIAEIVQCSGKGHIPSSFSIVDIVDHLYGEVLRYEATNPTWDERDYFVLSKGHGCAALYVVLRKYGFLTDQGLMNPHYTTSKAATINLAKYLSRAYADEGILVNVICPGPIMTPAMSSFVTHKAAQLGQSVDKMQVEFETFESAKVPLGRIGAPMDVGPLVAFLASEHASWITGSAFTVDGGKSTRI